VSELILSVLNIKNRERYRKIKEKREKTALTEGKVLQSAKIRAIISVGRQIFDMERKL